MHRDADVLNPRSVCNATRHHDHDQVPGSNRILRIPSAGSNRPGLEGISSLIVFVASTGLSRGLVETGGCPTDMIMSCLGDRPG
jgi:hypothetical protein